MLVTFDETVTTWTPRSRLRSAPATSAVSADHWPATRNLILTALKPHPEALEAVRQALIRAVDGNASP